MNKNIDMNTRLNCLQQIKLLHPNLGISNSAEFIENKCYEKSKNLESYISLSLSILKRSKQTQQPQIFPQFSHPLASVYKHIVINSSNNMNHSSDPLNALQSLAVSAGHSGIMTGQGNDPNIEAMNSSMHNAQVRTKPVLSSNSQKSLKSFPSTIHITQTQSIMAEVVDTTNTKNEIGADKNISHRPSIRSLTDTASYIISHQTAEENQSVSEEMKRLKDRYLGSLNRFIDKRKNNPEKEMKIWISIRNILDNPRMMSKPLSMKNLVKIEQLLMKAEQQLIHQESIQSNSFAVASANSSFRPVEGGVQCRRSLDVNVLDIAFTDACDQLMELDNKVTRRVQEGLVKYMQSTVARDQNVLPKRPFINVGRMEDLWIHKPKRSHLEEDSDIDWSKCVDPALTYSAHIFDSQGLLRTDLDIGSYLGNWAYQIEYILEIIRREFTIETMEEHQISVLWCTNDSDWSDSVFHSLTYNGQDVPTIVPAIHVRIPGDYLYCGYVDWNMNVDKYIPECGHFLGMVKCRLEENLDKIHADYHWSAVPLLYVVSVYKQSIVSAISEYQSLADNEELM